MRRNIFVVALIAAIAAFATAAFADNPHFISGPTCDQTSPNTIECAGKVAGLGNGPVYVVTNTEAGCTNQDGSHVVPGHSTSISGPFNTTNGQFTFGPDTDNRVIASGPSRCPGGLEPFISTEGLTLSIYQCTSGSPTFNKKTGAQTNSSCTLVLGPVSPA